MPTDRMGAALKQELPRPGELSRLGGRFRGTASAEPAAGPRAKRAGRRRALPVSRSRTLALAMSLVGTAAEIWRYPVKSMGGERLAQSAIAARRLHADRVWA